jgi:hypothetical protein
MQRMLLASALALGSMTAVALADSVTPAGGQAGPVSLLNEEQLDSVYAGWKPGWGPPGNDTHFGPPGLGYSEQIHWQNVTNHPSGHD